MKYADVFTPTPIVTDKTSDLNQYALHVAREIEKTLDEEQELMDENIRNLYL